MELKQIQELIRFVAKAGVTEVQLEQDDFKIVIKTGNSESQQQGNSFPQQVYHTGNFQQQQPQQQPQNNQSQQPKSDENNSANSAPAAAATNYETIKSPMIGTFYRKPSPDKDVFVKVGDKVSKGQVVCVIEAMKLFNEIEAEVSGTVVKILADDSTPVEYDQPLFLIEP
ncbi:MAG: acetyl-CoA carboxylase biotin carboxyl carrier protein [Sphingobacteriales bacterium]|nr:MAG: acetyl-CoA carboxylase biotin carboxyl carrier protein [Sphingobacteriales bacterium]